MRPSQPQKIHQNAGLADAVELVRAPPRPPVETCAGKQHVGIAQVVLGIRRALWILHVVKQEGGHDRVGRLRREYFEGTEVGHPLVRPRERLVLNDGEGGGGGSNVGGHYALLVFPCDDGAPVLQALGKGVVGSLRDAQSWLAVRERKERGGFSPFT